MKSFIRVYIALAVLMCMMAASCTSVLQRKDDVEFAENYAMEACLSNTIRNIDGYIGDSETFIPEKYIVLDKYRNDIPGMNYLLEQWRIVASKYTCSVLNDFGLFASNLTHSMTMPDRKELLASETSLTEALRNQYGTKISDFFYTSFSEGLCFDTFADCVKQYNKWLVVSNAADMKQIEYNDIAGELGAMITNMFFDELTECEKLFRKSKDPFNDARVTFVFNMR